MSKTYAEKELKKFDDYLSGKSSKRIEYGVVYPDGTVDWPQNRSLWFSRSDISTPDGRKEARADFNKQMAQLHAVHVRQIQFVQRTVKTSYTARQVILDPS